MFKTTEVPFFDNLCILLIHGDASLDGFKEHIEKLYDPCVDTVHVCVSKKLNLFRRARFFRHIRGVFSNADIRPRNVTDAQIKLVAFYIHKGGG